MARYWALALFSALLPIQTWCQSVQDDFTAPAPPDRFTTVQSGTTFTLLWKTGLQNSFPAYCPSCNVKNLDLWVTSFANRNYEYKIASSIDITTTFFYQWNVNIPSVAVAANKVWVLRFTPSNAQPPFAQQISSPGFDIIGPLVSSTIVSSSTVQSSSKFWSLRASPSASPSPTSTPTSTPTPQPESKAWIAGVVVGPIIGIALGAALMWWLLKRRRDKKARGQMNVGYLPGGPPVYHPGQQPVQKHDEPWQRQGGHQGQYPVEAPAGTPKPVPVEMWQPR
ncbi:hypothetical protein CC86DRAFT_287212 [Ophiobolus disseminans]|uniref:Mid2 domain-containing protein n=1 Tax=Ophiobolus disseminans TaxID=1469910 RepID=A0A6A7A9X8_9PLEO|nr:hypothetical protein CC86DRAFT_287212 [Ophiobolus disseminans]